MSVVQRLLLGLATTLAFALILPGTASARGEYEPNDSLTQAWGPLEGGKDYTATQETDNDVDWYRFYVRSQTQLRVTGTALHSEDDFDSYCHLELFNHSGRWLASTEMYVDQLDYIDYTLHAPGRHFIRVYCDYAGDRYRFSLSPASAIVTNEDCGEALTERRPAARALAKARAKVKRLRARKAGAKGKRAKRRVSAKLRAARALRRSAAGVLAEIDGRVATHC